MHAVGVYIPILHWHERNLLPCIIIIIISFNNFDKLLTDESHTSKKPQEVRSKSGKEGNFSPTKMKLRKTKREVRIFVSSTFRDFSEEREMIIKKVFRELNRICLDRGVFFTYVDLRWGITEDQTKGGKTIEICLREVGMPNWRDN